MTRHVSGWKALLSILAVFGLIAPAAAVVPNVVLGAGPGQVDFINFNDSTTGDWSQSGGPTLTYVDDGSGGKALSIERFNTWDTIQSATGIFAADTWYRFSVKAMLPASGAVTSIGAEFVVNHDSSSYDWAAAGTINNTGWTTLSGYYKLPAGSDPTTAKVYFQANDTSPQSTYTVLIDDLTVEPLPGTDFINFNDSTTGDWSQSGGPTLTYVDDGSGGKALSIERFNTWDTIQSATGIFAADTWYRFSVKAMLPASGAVTSIGAEFVVNHDSSSYDWAAAGTINNTGWTTLSGYYKLPAGSDPTTAKVYFQANDTSPQSTYTVLIDDLTVEPLPGTDFINFNDSTTGDWSQSGGPTLTYVDDGSGGKALSIERFNTWDTIQSATGIFVADTWYRFSVKAMLPASGAVTSIGAEFVVNHDSSSYDWAAAGTINNTGWTTLSGYYKLPAGSDPTTAKVYFQANDTSPQSTYTVLIDDLTVEGPRSTGGGSTGVLTSDCSNGYVALTYDDGPYAGQTNQLIAALDAAGLRATFFDWGQHISGNESLVAAQATNGWVGNHTWDHADLTTLTEQQITDELTQTQNAIQAADGLTPVLMRPPYGSTNATVKSVEASLGLTEILWNVDSQDWNGATTPQIVAAVRSAQSGDVVLMHDNLATTRAAIPLIADGFNATKKCPGMINPATGKAVAPPPQTVLSTDFENGGLDGWVARNGDPASAPTADLTATASHSPTHAALVSNRTVTGDGIGHDVTGLMVEGNKYVVTAWVKFAAGSPTDSIWLSMRYGTDVFTQLAKVTGVTGDTWKQVTAVYTMAAGASPFLYFETDYAGTNHNDFLVDDIKVELARGGIPDLTLEPIKDSVSFPVGVAVSSAETTGWPSVLALRHFNQVTLENSMKVEGWYDASKNFRMSPETISTLDWAQANNLRVYGHTLVWHSQTPDWFFQHDDGTDLTSSPADQAIFRARLQGHIDNVAKAISDRYGLFGSSTNPIVAFDVVNEVVSDGTTDPGGLRQSRYFQILGEEYIEDAFNWANQAFNVTYAAPAATRPVKLSINDYNTDQSGKRQRLHDLVALLLSHSVPVDLVGHQFHVSLTTQVQGLDDALAAFEDLPVKQAVTELDVSIAAPVTDAKKVDQGYLYRDAFRIFRARAADLFCVTVWGLYDSVSWHADQAPLIFGDSLEAKPAYYGVVDSSALPPRIRTANVFQADVPLNAGATTALEWKKLPLITFGTGDKVSFQQRWEPDHLSVYVAVNDATPDASDALTLKLGANTYSFSRNGTGDVSGVVSEVAGGWVAVVHIPLSPAAAEKDTLQFDVSDTDGSAVTGWNDPGAMGTLTLVETISFVEIAPANAAPVIDGAADPVWSLSNPEITTGKQVTGTDTATASVKLLYQGNMLYLFAHVIDPVLDATNSNPWEKDSVEIYVDNKNAKNGSYRTDDMQIRINYLNETSFGSGDTEANQRARLTSATQVVSDGYDVEAAISLLDGGGLNSFIGLDVQVNDASGGHRIGIRNWADATNAGYLSPSHWGVGMLAPDKTVPVLDVSSPLHLDSNVVGGYQGLTAAIAAVGATDAYDPASALTITNNAPAVLPVGTTVVTWTVTDPAGNTSSADQSVIVRDVTVPALTGPNPLYLTATSWDGYHGLTQAIAGVSATDAYDPPSALTITNNAPAVLPVGKTVVTWTVTDPAGNTSTFKQTVIVARRIPTQLFYIGERQETVKKSSTLTVAAILVAPCTSCRSGMPVTFSLNRDPVTGLAVSTVIGTATTDRFGIAALRVSSKNWAEGRYTLTVSYAGNNLGCVASTDTVTIIVVVPQPGHGGSSR